MEYNTEKKYIGQRVIVKEELQEQPVEAEWNLPDYCSDIERVLKCCGNVRITSRRVTGRTAYVDGYTSVTVIYADSEGCVSSYEQSVPFYREIPLDEENLKIQVEGCVDYLNCRAVSQKRLEVRGAIGLKITVFSERKVELIVSAAGEGIETKLCKRSVTSHIGVFEKHLTVSDQMEIEEGRSPIHTVLKCNASVCDTQVQPITGKAVVNGNVKVKMLYSTKAKTPEIMEISIPFNQIIDTEGSDELCVCSLRCEVTSLDIHTRTGVDGECRSAGITAGVLLCVKVEETVECDFVEDAYSTKYEAQLTQCSQPLYYRVETLSQKITITEEVEFSQSVGEIFDLWCDRNNCYITADDVFAFNGNSTVSVLVSDSEGNPLCFEKDINYNFKSELNISDKGICPFNIAVQDVGYTIKSNITAEIRLLLDVTAELYEPLNFAPITDLLLDESRPKTPGINRAPIIVYYPSHTDTLFGIAAKYNTSVAEIKSANGIEDDNSIGGVLLIPTQN